MEEAAILVSIASIFATVSWVMSGMAGNQTDKYQTSALSYTVARLESSTEAYTKTSEASTLATQAEIMLLIASETEDENLASYLENRWAVLMNMVDFNLEQAKNKENEVLMYADKVSDCLSIAEEFSDKEDNRSTAALLFALTALVSSSAILVKRKELLYVDAPILAIAAYYLAASLL